jgi:hypothetical protein
MKCDFHRKPANDPVNGHGVDRYIRFPEAGLCKRKEYLEAHLLAPAFAAAKRTRVSSNVLLAGGTR